VRVKVLNVSLPLPRHLSNFQHEHQVVADSLRGVEGVVRILARLSRPGVEALVVEDFGGESLDKWLQREGAFAAHMGRFLCVALSVARTLGHIHSRSVVHKDIKVLRPLSLPLTLPLVIKSTPVIFWCCCYSAGMSGCTKSTTANLLQCRRQPHNIIWNKKTGVVKITDFGIASIVIRSKDTTSVSSSQFNSSIAQHVLGSLPYLPPELSLRSGDAGARPVDHRSDFYSLGVTFFELLTGSVPFHERSAVRMMHAHMAKQAPAVHEVDGRVARCVSAVVGRLLAKSVEERYQSSRGLVADLLRCERIVGALRRRKRRLQRKAQRSPCDKPDQERGEEEEVDEDDEWAEKADREFVAGEDDVSDVFAFPAKLYGREDQIHQLKNIYLASVGATGSAKQARNQVCIPYVQPKA
jgi:serine/threonine protein kinase